MCNFWGSELSYMYHENNRIQKSDITPAGQVIPAGITDHSRSGRSGRYCTGSHDEDVEWRGKRNKN